MLFFRILFVALLLSCVPAAFAQDLTDFAPITTETSGIEVQTSAPVTCDGSAVGRVYFDTTEDQFLICDGVEYVTSSDDQNRVVYVDTTRPLKAGEVYATLAAAVAYVNTQTPGASAPWSIVVQPGTNSESVTLPVHTVLVGYHRTKNTFSGTITLSNGSAVQDVTVSGFLDIAAGNTGHITSSDVILDDGASGGIDGAVTVHNSLVDGETSATGTLTAISSQIGVTSFVNAGTLTTYHSSVFNLTGAGAWNNFGDAYNNQILSAANRLNAQTTQAALDELVLGTPADNFTIDENQSIAQDVTITFGNIVLESLVWDETNDYFILSDALVVDGNVNIQGTTLRLDSDEVANPDQDLEIVAEQGSEADGVIRYDDGNNRWEISNNGGPFAAISTGGGGSTDFEGVYSTDADKVLTTSNGLFTVNTGTNDFVVDSADWNVSSTGALDAATITSNGLLTGSAGATVSAGTISFNASSNFATNINTGTSTGAVTIGGGSGTVAVNSTSWDISTTGVASGFTGVTSAGAISLGNNTGTVVLDGTNFDVTSAGAVTLTGNLTLSGDANEGISGGGLVDCDASNQSLQWDVTTNKFKCTTAGNRTATFNDPTDDNSVSYTSATDLWDGTQPNITLDTTGSTVLVSVVIQTRSDENNDQQPAFSIHRETNGTNATCSDPQVGIDVWGSFITVANQEDGISATFLDTPAFAGNVRYTVCTADSGLDDGNILDIQLTLVEMGN